MLIGSYPIVTTLFGNELIPLTDPSTSDPLNNVTTDNLAIYIAAYLTTITAISNIGNLGVGVAFTVTGTTAQFNNIAPNSSKLSVSLDNTNHNVLLDVVPANINVNSLAGLPVPVASGGTGVTTSTGSGAVVLQSSPTLISPILGNSSSTSETITGTGGSGFIELQVQSIAPVVGSTNSNRLFTGSLGSFGWKNQADGFDRFFTGTLTASRSYTLPDQAGTLTLLGNATTGSGSIVLSTSPFLVTPTIGVSTGTSLVLNGTAGAGYIELDTQSANPSVGATNSVRIFSSSIGNFSWKKATDGFVRGFSSILTADRLYTLQDSSDTFVMRSTTDILTNKTINGSSNTITNVSLTAGVNGTLPVANGGTGVTSSTGSGSNVLSINPSLTTPSIGSALATSINFGGQSLSAYNTGTFVPVLQFGGASTGITYTTQLATYTTIGNITYFTINITLSNKGSDTGNATITGLPVTISATYNSIAKCVVENITFLATNNVEPFLTAGSTTITLVNQVNNNVVTNYTNAQFSNTSILFISGFYF